MAVMAQTLVPRIEPEVIHASEDRALVVWQELYPDHWLLLEVTHEEDSEPVTGRLLAVASTDIALVRLWQEYIQQGKITALLYGRSTDAGPTVVA
jgi:hypothetical protein